jgi:anti-sigma factor RsiW
MAIDPCKNESLLSALLDGELSGEESSAIRQHLESCPLCRQRLEATQKADAAVRGMTRIEPSADFDRVFWRKIADLENREKRRFRIGSLLTGWRPLFATGMAAAIATAILIYTGQNKNPTQDEAIIAQNIELLQDYDIIEQLDILEHWNDLETIKEPS